MRVILVMLLAVMSASFLASCGKTESKRRTMGYKGEARSNAFLAAQRLLDSRGREVEKRSGLGVLDYSTSLVFVEPSTLNTAGRGKRLLEWVDRGGHLVLMISGGERTGNDFRFKKRDWSLSDEQPAGVEYLLDEMGVSLIEWETRGDKTQLDTMDIDEWEALPEDERVLLGSEVSTLTLMGRELKIHHQAGDAFEFKLRGQMDVGSMDEPGDDKHRFLSVARGSGRVTLLSDGGPLRNRYLGQADHAQLLVDLVSLSRGGKVIFSAGAGEGFFGLVWRYFWMLVVAVAAAVAFWLWKNLPRFGPLQDLPEGTMREYSGQLRGVGRFFWKHKRDDVLLGALRQNINRRISLTSGANHSGIFEQLSEKTGLPEEEVIEAMTRQDISEPGVMVRVTRNLQKIYQQIN